MFYSLIILVIICYKTIAKNVKKKQWENTIGMFQQRDYREFWAIGRFRILWAQHQLEVAVWNSLVPRISTLTSRNKIARASARATNNSYYGVLVLWGSTIYQNLFSNFKFHWIYDHHINIFFHGYIWFTRLLATSKSFMYI